MPAVPRSSTGCPPEPRWRSRPRPGWAARFVHWPCTSRPRLGCRHGSGPDDYEPKLNRLLSQGKRTEAVDLFMTVVGVPPEMIAGMHQAPMWPGLEAVAPTLAYDAACMNGFVIPRDRSSTTAHGGRTKEKEPERDKSDRSE